MKTVVPLRVLTIITAVTMVTAVAAFSVALFTDSGDWIVVGLLASLLAVRCDQRRTSQIVSNRLDSMADKYGQVVWFWQTDIDALKHGTERPDPVLLGLPTPREPEPRETRVP